MFVIKLNKNVFFTLGHRLGLLNNIVLWTSQILRAALTPIYYVIKQQVFYKILTPLWLHERFTC